MSTAAPQAETTALVTPWMALCGVCRWMWMVKADQTNWLQLNGRVLPLIEDNTISCPSSTPKFKLDQRTEAKSSPALGQQGELAGCRVRGNGRFSALFQLSRPQVFLSIVLAPTRVGEIEMVKRKCAERGQSGTGKQPQHAKGNGRS